MPTSCRPLEREREKKSSFPRECNGPAEERCRTLRLEASRRLDRAKRRLRHLELPRRFVDVVAVTEMQPSRELRKRMRRFAEGHVGPIKPDVSISHVDADAGIRFSERVVGEVKIDGL